MLEMARKNLTTYLLTYTVKQKQVFVSTLHMLTTNTEEAARCFI